MRFFNFLAAGLGALALTAAALAPRAAESALERVTVTSNTVYFVFNTAGSGNDSTFQYLGDNANPGTVLKTVRKAGNVVLDSIGLPRPEPTGSAQAFAYGQVRRRALYSAISAPVTPQAYVEPDVAPLAPVIVSVESHASSIAGKIAYVYKVAAVQSPGGPVDSVFVTNFTATTNPITKVYAAADTVVDSVTVYARPAINQSLDVGFNASQKRRTLIGPTSSPNVHNIYTEPDVAPAAPVTSHAATRLGP